MRILLAPLAALCLASPLAASAQTGLLNDTGTMWSGDASSGNANDCDATHPAAQDCHYGRDKAAADGNLTKIGGGSAGFDFTKVCNSGEWAGQGACPADPALGSGANEWACTHDNVTGLIWEVKVDDATHLRHQHHTYSWFMTASPDSNPGTANGGSCHVSGRCDTEKFVHDVNAAGLCSATDWRMPTIKELEGIADLGRHTPAIDTSYFPNTPSSEVWSGSPVAGNPYSAWYVGFGNGNAGYGNRNGGYRVRLVRGGQ